MSMRAAGGRENRFTGNVAMSTAKECKTSNYYKELLVT